MNRRSFLGTILALGAAPAIVKAESLMRLSVRRHEGFYIALFTADGEASYAGYERQQLARDPDNWEIVDGVARNRKEILFPECIGGYSRVTKACIVDGRGRTHALEVALVAELRIDPGVSPVFYPGRLPFALK